jgi:serine/threonine protein kinase
VEIVSPFSILRGPEIGRGAFGIVYDGMWKESRVAIKVITEMTPEALAEFEREAATMQSIPPHPNVITLMGICHEPYALIQDFMANGSLDVWLKHNPLAPPEAIMTFVRGIVQGMIHLHQLSIIHRE